MHGELTTALRFSLPLCLAGCCGLFLHFIFVLFLFLITSRILEQDQVHLIQAMLLLPISICMLIHVSLRSSTWTLKTSRS